MMYYWIGRSRSDVWKFGIMAFDELQDLQWTTTPPTVEGWYWVIDDEEKIYCERFFTDMRVLCVSSHYSDVPIPVSRLGITHWLGPLPPPEPPKDEPEQPSETVSAKQIIKNYNRAVRESFDQDTEFHGEGLA